MWRLRDILFGLFGNAEKRADTNGRDAQGRGLQERFVRALGAEYDEQLLPLVDGLLANCVNPETALAKFVPYLEQQMGVSYQVSDELAIRRKLIAWAPRITRLKGTKRSYEILLKLMGFTVVDIEEHPLTNGLDSPTTFDDEERRFDGGCSGCSQYSLRLSGTLLLTDDVKEWVRSVIVFCEPINAQLRDIYYNDVVVIYGRVRVQVNELGDLYYENSAAPNTTLQLLPNGDLVVKGQSARSYKRDNGGDLTYQ